MCTNYMNKWVEIHQNYYKARWNQSNKDRIRGHQTELLVIPSISKNKKTPIPLRRTLSSKRKIHDPMEKKEMLH